MIDYHVKIEFLHKTAKTMKVKAKEGFSALTIALENLNSAERDNVISVAIVYMN